MATRVIKVDDLDSKSEADESITYGLEGDFYEVDLSTGNADKRRAALAPFIKVSRSIQPRDAIRARQPSRPPTATGRRSFRCPSSTPPPCGPGSRTTATT